MNLSIEISCLLYATEDPEKVEQAMRNIIPLPTFSVKEIPGKKMLYGRTTDPKVLDSLFQKVREQRILDAGRKTLKTQRIDDEVEFFVHKQAATAGKVSFCHHAGESPLGMIAIKITSPQLDMIIDWLAPYTREGKIVEQPELIMWGNQES